MSKKRSWFDDYEDYRLYQEIFGEDDDDAAGCKAPKCRQSYRSKEKN